MVRGELKLDPLKFRTQGRGPSSLSLRMIQQRDLCLKVFYTPVSQTSTTGVIYSLKVRKFFPREVRKFYTFVYKAQIDLQYVKSTCDIKKFMREWGKLGGNGA